MKKIGIGTLVVLAAMMFCFMAASCGKKQEGAQQTQEAAAPKLQSKYLKIEKYEYEAGGIITVQYTGEATWDKSAWVGIIPSGTAHGEEKVADEVDNGIYHKLDGELSGSYNFPVPATPGTYDIRMFDNDNDGKEMDSLTFNVVAAQTPPK